MVVKFSFIIVLYISLQAGSVIWYNKIINIVGGFIMPVKVTNEMFLERVLDAVGEEYTPLSVYKGSTEKVKFIHNTCGSVFMQSPNHFLKDKRRCTYCNHKNAKSPDDFDKEFNSLSDGEYKLLSRYHRSTEKVTVYHIKCKKSYNVTPKAFLKGERCPYCYGNARKTTEQFKSEVASLTKGEYLCEGDYKNNRTKIKMKHTKCNHEYLVSPHDFLSGNRCPYCKQSKGEKLIEDILDSLEVPYDIQKSFSDCGSVHQWLPFDFYVESLNLLIEYDGIQHFKPVKYYGGDYKLKDQRRRDAIKDKYAKEHGISLLRIPYSLSFNHVTSSLKTYIKERNTGNLEPKVEIMI